MLQFDVSRREETAAILLADVEAHGGYHGVVCNAGIARDNAFPAMTGEDWDVVIHTNLDAFYNVLHPLVMPMVRRRKPGRIVTLSSVSGLMGNRGQVNYSAAKAGIIGATKALAVELAKPRDHRQLRGAGAHRDRDGRTPGWRGGAEADPGAAPGHAGRGRGGGVLPDRQGRGLRHAAGDLRERRHVRMKRVVVTGVGALSPLGQDWTTVEARLRARRNAVR